MATQKKTSLLILCVLTCLNTLAFSLEPNDLDYTLSFEYAPAPNDLESGCMVEMTVNNSGCFISFSNPAEWNLFGNYLNRSKVLGSVSSRVVTGRLRHTILRFSDFQIHYLTLSEKSSEYQTFECRVPDEKKAKAIAQLYFNCAMQQYDKDVIFITSKIESCTHQIAGLERIISEIEQELPKAKQEFEALKSQIRYQSVEEAQQAIQELNRILTGAEVNIAGIRAAINTIQDFQAQRLKTNPDVARTLESSLVEQTIALKAAQAREITARNARTQAVRYIDLTDYVSNKPNQLAESKRNLESNRGDLEIFTQSLEQLIKPEVIGNKVTIYTSSESQD